MLGVVYSVDTSRMDCQWAKGAKLAHARADNPRNLPVYTSQGVRGQNKLAVLRRAAYGSKLPLTGGQHTFNHTSPIGSMYDIR